MDLDLEKIRRLGRKVDTTASQEALMKTLGESYDRVVAGANSSAKAANTKLKEEGFEFDREAVEIKRLHFDDIEPDPDNRDANKRIDEMKEDIKAVGFLINMIWVYDKGDGKYMILSGERRYRGIAALREGDDEEQEMFKERFLNQYYIVCSRDVPFTKARMIAFMDNNSRVDPTPAENHKAIKMLLDEYERQKEENKTSGIRNYVKRIGFISQNLGISERSAKRELQIFDNLSHDLEQLYENGIIGKHEAEELSRMSPELQERAYEVFSQAENVTRDTAETIIKSLKANQSTKEATDNLIGKELTELKAKVNQYAKDENEGKEMSDEEKADHEKNIARINDINEITEAGYKPEDKPQVNNITVEAKTKTAIRKLKNLIINNFATNVDKAILAPEDKETIKELIEKLEEYID